MKTTRRNFFKVLAGTVGAVALTAIVPFKPSFPEVEAQSAIKPKGKHPKDVLCQDFNPQVTIQDYKPGETIKYIDLAKIEHKCNNCMFEDRCTCTGERFCGLESGQYVPEIWSKKLMKKWYEKSFVGKL